MELKVDLCLFSKTLTGCFLNKMKNYQLITSINFITHNKNKILYMKLKTTIDLLILLILKKYWKNLT